jgi:hypothetical protein
LLESIFSCKRTKCAYKIYQSNNIIIGKAQHHHHHHNKRHPTTCFDSMTMKVSTLTNAALVLLASSQLTLAFTPIANHNIIHGGAKTCRSTTTSLGYSSSSSSSSLMETDYASLYHDVEQQEQQELATFTTFTATSATTDEQLFVASAVPTFDRFARAYSDLSRLWSGSAPGQPSMMEELLRQQRALADQLSLEAAAAEATSTTTTTVWQEEAKQQQKEKEEETVMPTTVAVLKKTTAISFESDGLMMVETTTTTARPRRLL